MSATWVWDDCPVCGSAVQGYQAGTPTAFRLLPCRHEVERHDVRMTPEPRTPYEGTDLFWALRSPGSPES